MDIEIFTRTKSKDKKQRLQKKGSYFEHKSKFILMKETNLLSEYDLESRIGQGAYGSVFKARDKLTKQNVAIKSIKKASLNFKPFENEIALLKQLDHPNIIRIIEILFDPNYVYIVQEYASGGDLYSFLKKQKNFKEEQARQIMKQILSALIHLHANKIVHRDLKPENVVFMETSKELLIKLIDFGTSIKFTEKKMTQELGTVSY